MGNRKMQIEKLAMFHTSRTALEKRMIRFNAIVRQEVLYAHTMGISQTDIANALGVSKQRVWQIVQGHKNKMEES